MSGSQPALLNTVDDALGRRIVATLVDSVLVFAVLYAGMFGLGGPAIAQAVGLAPPVVIGFYLWYVFAVLGFAPLLVMHGYSSRWFAVGVGLWVLYGTVFEAAWGATPGKRLAGVVVVADDGSPLGPGAALVRNLLRFVDALGFYLLGFIVLSMNDKRQRLGDRLAGTVVVLAHPGAAPVPGRQAVRSGEPERSGELERSGEPERGDGGEPDRG